MVDTLRMRTISTARFHSMERVENLELKEVIVTHLADLYDIRQKREPNHLSTYISCLTRAYFDQAQPIMPTSEEVMMFAVGYGLQDVLTPPIADAPLYNIDGIIYRPDMMIDVEGFGLTEVKTTRANLDKIHKELPPTWLEYMKGGCFMMDKDFYDLAVLALFGNYKPPFPDLYCERIMFTSDELFENWDLILSKRIILEDALSEGVPPEPKKYCHPFECNKCRYALLCDAILFEGG